MNKVNFTAEALVLMMLGIVLLKIKEKK